MPANSKSQQRFMGMVHQCKKSGKCASAEVKKVADSMKDSDAKDFAKTKHKGLPEKIKESVVLSFKEYLLEMISDEEVDQSQQQLSSMLAPYGLTFDYGGHGGKDKNNRIQNRERSVTQADMVDTMGRFLKAHGGELKQAIESEDGIFKVNVKDYANNLNLALDLHDKKRLKLVTIMRKNPNQFKNSDYPEFKTLKVFAPPKRRF